jgi:hypothetical protein
MQARKAISTAHAQGNALLRLPSASHKGKQSHFLILQLFKVDELVKVCRQAKQLFTANAQCKALLRLPSCYHPNRQKEPLPSTTIQVICTCKAIIYCACVSKAFLGLLLPAIQESRVTSYYNC